MGWGSWSGSDRSVGDDGCVLGVRAIENGMVGGGDRIFWR